MSYETETQERFEKAQDLLAGVIAGLLDLREYAFELEAFNLAYEDEEGEEDAEACAFQQDVLDEVLAAMLVTFAPEDVLQGALMGAEED